MLPLGNGEVVTRIRAAQVADRYNPNAVRLDWSMASRLDLVGCAVAQESVSEPVTDARVPADYVWTVYAPADADVKAEDRLEIRGQDFDVIGAPFAWRNPFTGWAPGVAIRCRLRTG